MYRDIERGFRIFQKLVEAVLIAVAVATAEAIRFVGAKLQRRGGESK